MKKQFLLLALQPSMSQWKFEIALVEDVSIGEKVLPKNVLFQEKCTLGDHARIKDAIDAVLRLRSADSAVLMQHHISGRDNTLREYNRKECDFSTTSAEDIDQIVLIGDSLNVVFLETKPVSVN